MEEAMERLRLSPDNSLETSEFEVVLNKESISKKCKPIFFEDEEAVPIRIVKPELLKQDMTMEIKDAAELTCLRPTSVRILLNMFQWDKSKMLEQTAYGESFTQLRDIGIIINPTAPVNSPIVPTSSMTQKRGGACLSCRKTVKVSSMVVTSCEHWFCMHCFQRHLMSEMKIGDRSHFKCPYTACLMYLEDDIVLNYLQPHLRESYLQLCLADFVRRSKFRGRCPTTGCNRTSVLDVNLSTKCREVQCDCGTSYCFGCSNLWHYPLSCRQLRKWLKIFGDIPDYTTIANFKSNTSTKPCPYCSVFLSNLKTTRITQCKTCNYTFCWVCMDRVVANRDHVCTQQCSTETQPELKALVMVNEDYDELKTKFSMFENEKMGVNGMGHQNEIIKKVMSSMDKICETIRKSQLLMRHSIAFSYFLDNNLQKLRFLNQVFQFQTALVKLVDDFEQENDVSNMEGEVDHEREQLLQGLDEAFEHELWIFRECRE